MGNKREEKGEPAAKRKQRPTRKKRVPARKTISPLSLSKQLTVLSDLLASRREAILLAWRKAARSDPEQKTGRSLTTRQFLDHIPQILDAFELKLRSRADRTDSRIADQNKKKEVVKHGLHRWQQGYRLKELMNECGHLQFCLFEELNNIARTNHELEQATFVEAYRQLLHLINDTISESAVQYERMQQAQASWRVGDLMGALADIKEIEKQRATLLQHAFHDLNTDVMGVSMAATHISRTDMEENDRTESMTFLQRAVEGLNSMLGELMDLARLEAGQEIREIEEFDASTLIRELCESYQPFARERDLYLKMEGPKSCCVEGDANKVRRAAKNLLVNALKYTETGGVIVSWGREEKNWWLKVDDTGPGMLTESGMSMVLGLQEATASAKESDEKSSPHKGTDSQVLTPPKQSDTPSTTPPPLQHGEGIGLSIVKNLCELLDASLEMASSSKEGTTFRIVFPLLYESHS